jgi:hypothetical protein
LQLNGTFLLDANFGWCPEGNSMPPEEYRRHAAECLRLADGLADPRQRLALIDMA